MLKDFMTEYRQKLCTPEEAVEVVKSGDWVDYTSSLGKPVLLDKALAKRRDELFDVKIRGNLVEGPIEVAECDETQEHFVYHTWHCSAYERKLCDRGLCYYIPMVFHNNAAYYKYFLNVNVVMVSVSPMDKHGYFNYSVNTGVAGPIVQNADVVIVPIGGGGLCAGVAFAIKQINPKCRVYGVQAQGAPSMLHSVDDGKIETLDKVQTIADGIAVKTPGNLTFEMVNKYVDGIVTVSDDEIALAILTLLEQQKLIAEGAGAVPVAAVLAGKVPDIEGKNVCCLVSGGNIDVTILSRVIERGLKMSGRTAHITIALSDKPGQLSGVSKIIAETGANVTSINYDSTDLDMNITDCYLKIEVETRDFAHIVAIKKALKDAGFEVCDR